jgi:toxin ParE1/3/4
LRVVWLPRAIADFDSQLDYIAKDNPRIATDIGDRIVQHVSHLSEYPEMGRDGRRQKTRELVVPRTPFVIVYRVGSDRLEILRVLHGAQRWPPQD